jgi:hypothetical protein
MRPKAMRRIKELVRVELVCYVGKHRPHVMAQSKLAGWSVPADFRSCVLCVMAESGDLHQGGTSG